MYIKRAIGNRNELTMENLGARRVGEGVEGGVGRGSALSGTSVRTIPPLRGMEDVSYK